LISHVYLIKFSYGGMGLENSLFSKKQDVPKLNVNETLYTQWDSRGTKVILTKQRKEGISPYSVLTVLLMSRLKG
jgi:hypothetical protein